MRGRTNASNGGIFLNATTDSFEVATGNTIVAGDFCEYIYDTEIKTLSGTITLNSKCYLVDASSNLYIALINSIATLFTFTNNTITIVDTYPYTVSYLFQFDTTTYFANKYILQVDVQNQTLSLLANSPSSIVTKVTDNIIANVTSTGIFTYDATDLTNVTAMSNLTGQDVGTFLCAYNNKIYSLFGSTGSYGKLYLIPWTVDTSTGAITKGTMKQIASTGSSSSATTNRIEVLSNKLLDNRYAIFAYAYASYSTSNDHIGIYDFQQASLIVNYYSGSNTLIGGNAFATDFNSDGEIMIGTFSTEAIELFKFDATNLNFEMLDKQELSDENWRAIFGFNNKKYAVLTYVDANNSGYIPFDGSNEQITIGELTDTVQEWQGSGNPMGVAKQSGTAGDTIEVYIPSVNS